MQRTGTRQLETKEIGAEETRKLLGDFDKRKEDKNVETKAGPDTHKDHNTSQSKGKEDRDYIQISKGHKISEISEVTRTM